MEFDERHFSVIDSTNKWAKENAHNLDQNKITIVTADQQTHGRGRSKRFWYSPKGKNLYVSFCFFLSPNSSSLANIAQVMAISVAQLLTDMHFSPKLKWPNDLLLSNKKVGGILCETVSSADKILMIVGIGLNVNITNHDLLNIDQAATSLSLECDNEISISTVLAKLKTQITSDLLLFKKQGFKPFLEHFRSLTAWAIGKQIHFHDGQQKKWSGTLHSIADNGSLNLKLSTGEVKNFTSGECFPDLGSLSNVDAP